MLKQQARTIAALLYAADLSVTLATLPVAYALRSELLPRLFNRLTPLYEFNLYLVLVAPTVLIFSGLLFLEGAYRSHRTLRLKDEVALMTRASFFGSLLLAERVTVRLVARRVRSLGFNFRTVVLVGDTPRAASMARLIREHPWWGLKLLGLVREKPAEDGQTTTANGVPLLGSLQDFPKILTEFTVDEVVLAVDRGDLPKLEDIFLLCEEMGVKTRLVLDFFPHVLARVELEELEGTPLLTFSTTPGEGISLLVKRVVDIFLSVLIGVVSLVPVTLAALVIKLTSRGPVLFRQTRCGLNGRPFTLVKLRTMIDGAEELMPGVQHLNEHDGPVFKAANDPRLTAFGRLIRRFSFDELPQLWNLSLIHISEPTRQAEISYAVFC